MQNLALLFGLVIAEWITMSSRAQGASGYLLLALRKASGLILPVMAARWAIAWIFLFLSRLSGVEIFNSYAWAFVLGMIAVFSPAALEKYIETKVTSQFVTSTLIQLLLRFNLLSGQIVKGNIQKIKEQDNYDCQHSLGWWDLGLSREKVSRRLRILYEAYKLDIACARKQPDLLRHDVGIHPNQKFYLLVARLGRNRLRRVLQQPPPPPSGPNWDGSERRREIGSKAHRRPPDPTPMNSRIYDDEELRSKILKGTAIDSADGISKD